ncbi:hypothetical protein M0208_16950 [Sphingomonas sp. SUN019]|uniref:hypothetical protein n=1 Tax=Sphingomonas sp. SUN019 TaxID=2937788 RepID=UPI002164ED51|nr:hypothetical protein [Sphingomonas sp. SUN019]UVO52116.1 hypothetical protein M0208_16950 [Sphingomonas sp. SUN019]
MLLIVGLSASAAANASAQSAGAEVGLDQSAAGESAAEPTYSVAPLRFEITSDIVVGRRKSGVFCLPAGDLRWSDAAPDPARAASMLARALHRSGVDISVDGDDWLGDKQRQGELRLIVAVKRVRLNACFPQWGPAKLTSRTRKFNGEGVAEISWRVYDGTSRKRIAAGHLCQNLRISSDQLSMPDAMAEGLAGAAPEIAISIKSERQPETKGVAENDSTVPICHEL